MGTDDRYATVPTMIIPALCSLGFDCFNLIGLGVAKDITKHKDL